MDTSLLLQPDQLRIALDIIAINLANEGVPVRAIARSMKHTSENIRDILKDSISSGCLIALPGDDWPPGSNPHARTPAQFQIRIDDDSMLAHIMITLTLTRLMARVFAKLLRRGQATKELLHTAIEENRRNRDEETDDKMVDVVICNMRKRLKKHNVKITTVHAVGYALSIDMRKHALRLLGMDNILEVGF